MIICMYSNKQRRASDIHYKRLYLKKKKKTRKLLVSLASSRLTVSFAIHLHRNRVIPAH